MIHPRSLDGAVSLYVTGSDGQVWTNFWPAIVGSNQWNGWFSIDPKPFPQGFPVSVIYPRSDDGAVSLYTIDTEGKVCPELLGPLPDQTNGAAGSTWVTTRFPI